MITKSQAEILSIIMAWGDAGGTTESVFKSTADIKGSEITEIKQVSAIAGELKKAGLISTFAGKVKAHVITKQGMLALDTYNSLLGTEAVKPAAIDPERILTANSIPDKFEVARRRQAQAVINGLVGPTPLPQSITSALNLLQNAGYTILDPENEVDDAFITILESIRRAENTKAAPIVEKKSQKIATLATLGLYMSDDIKAVLDDISKIIEQLDEAA